MGQKKLIQSSKPGLVLLEDGILFRLEAKDFDDSLVEDNKIRKYLKRAPCKAKRFSYCHRNEPEETRYYHSLQ